MPYTCRINLFHACLEELLWFGELLGGDPLCDEQLALPLCTSLPRMARDRTPPTSINPSRQDHPVALINWHAIDTVLLDMDGTLLDLHFDNHFWQTHLPRRYADTHGMSHEAALDHLQQRFEKEHGSLNWYCLDFWRDELALDIVALKREVSHLIALRPHSARFLDALRAAGKVVWLVTNAHPDSIALKLEHTPLAQWLDRITSAHTLGAAKESQDFWSALQRLHPFDISRTLFVDDTLRVLQSARLFGIQNLLWITQPDSRAPAHDTVTADTAGLIAIDDFDQVLPVTGNRHP